MAASSNGRRGDFQSSNRRSIRRVATTSGTSYLGRHPIGYGGKLTEHVRAGTPRQKVDTNAIQALRLMR